MSGRRTLAEGIAKGVLVATMAGMTPAITQAIITPSVAYAEANVAKIGGTEYATLQAALDAAQDGDTIVLLDDINATGTMYTNDTRFNLWISKSITIDGDGQHDLTVKGRGIGIQGASGNIDVTFKDVNISNVGNANGRCIDTRGKLNSLTLDGVTLSTAESSYTGYLQPLTIGGESIRYNNSEHHQ